LRMALKVGIDVGGTHTDAVIVSDKNEIIATVKTNTTPDVTQGIIESLDLALKTSGVSVSEIKYVMIGTTHCINAITERRRLARVAVIRICEPAGKAIPPMYRWPHELRNAIGGEIWYTVKGGYDYDGRKIGEFSDAEVRAVVRDALQKGVEAFAVTGVFSPVIPEQEQRVHDIIRELAGDSVHISLSHKIGRIGLIERENATILNAALFKVAQSATEAIQKACEDRDIHAKLYFSQNDGTLMSVEYAKQYPILTIASGPTNSFRGASFLTNLKDAIVVDIGGTTMLAGMLVNGFPRQSAAAVEVGGVRTNFRMPDLVSFGCGGGTVVKLSSNGFSIGPESVGYELERRAIAWGGDTLTTTDVAIALGYARIEDPNVKPERLRDLDRSTLEKVANKIVAMLEDAVERVKTRKENMPMILVGGGGIIIPPERYDSIRGVSEVIRPQAFQYANALGAAIAQVGGEIEKVFSLDNTSRSEVINRAKELAIEEAVKAGAKKDTVEVVDIDEVFLTYLPSNAVRVRVKAAGELQA